MKLTKNLFEYFLAIHLLILISCGATDSSDDNNNQNTPPETGTVTDIDGNIYKTIKIGNQWWMAENLKTVHFSDGMAAASYIYNNDETNLIFGRLYTWRTVVNGTTDTHNNPSTIQGIAPIGWHIPSKAEWEELINYLGGVDVAGGKLKKEGETHWKNPNTGATNQSLFSALPGGMYAFWHEYQWLG